MSNNMEKSFELRSFNLIVNYTKNTCGLLDVEISDIEHKP